MQTPDHVDGSAVGQSHLDLDPAGNAVAAAKVPGALKADVEDLAQVRVGGYHNVLVGHGHGAKVLGGLPQHLERGHLEPERLVFHQNLTFNAKTQTQSVVEMEFED